MKRAPFLLQAFAARILAAKSHETILRAELARQGYDVEVLVQMIETYQSVPDAEKEFLVRANATDILIRRKPNSPVPTTPTATAPGAPATTTTPGKPQMPGAQFKLADLVKANTAKMPPRK